MTQLAIPDTPVTMSLRMGTGLRLSDDELFELCARNPELRIVEVLDDPAEVSADPELPRFVLALEPVWQPL